MSNLDTSVGRDYHEGTKHPHGALFDPYHDFNPMISPPFVKSYHDGEQITLPLEKTSQGLGALEAISITIPFEGAPRVPDLATLARVLFYSAGVTKRLRYPGRGEPVPFRAAACTGALYHIELYVVCGDLEGLGAGVYYFDPEGFLLQRLRSGDHRGVLVEAGAREPSLLQAPVILVFADAYWRNATKYQAREYRHAFWDSGTILAHTLAMAAAHELPARALLGFVDREVDRLLGLEDEPEMPLALVPVGWAENTSPPSRPAWGPLEAEPEPVTDFKTRYPAIERMHDASALEDPAAVDAWREGSISLPFPPPSARTFDLSTDAEGDLSEGELEATILRRGSTRRFDRVPITFGQLSVVLDRATRGAAADFLNPAEATLNHLYLIVNAVEGLPSGAYVYHRDLKALELLKAGEFRSEAGALGLNQGLPADASANVFFLTDLAYVFERFGNRGYRAAQLEASLMAGRMYLAAYALGFGATGLTFFDDAVTNFFSPHATGRSAMFLIALGVKDRRRATP